MEDHIVRDQEEKKKMKLHVGRRNRTKTSKLKLGDYVLIQVPKGNKLSMSNSPKSNTKGNMIAVRYTEHTVTRNVSFFQYLPNYKKPEQEEQHA